MTNINYDYIYKEKKGYTIRKNNENYGYYQDIREALFERDRLIQSDWDWEVFVHLPDVPNGYANVELPPFNKNKSYITYVEYWKIQKRINGKLKVFGTYNSLEEAEKQRDKLIENNWDYDLVSYNNKIESIRDDLLKVYDNPIELKKRIEFYRRDSPKELEVILNDKLAK